MIRIKDIKIREDLLEEKVLEKALQKNRLQKDCRRIVDGYRRKRQCTGSDALCDTTTLGFEG